MNETHKSLTDRRHEQGLPSAQRVGHEKKEYNDADLLDDSVDTGSKKTSGSSRNSEILEYLRRVVLIMSIGPNGGQK